VEVEADKGELFLVQELPEGKSLKELLREGPLPLGRVLRMAAQIASALGAAHRLGMVHGNLAPWNVFLSKTGEVRILGLGLSAFAGDPQYFSPEKAEGQPLRPSSDVFSLGAILYESLAGYPPFAGENRDEVLKRVVYGPPPRLRLARPDVPQEAEGLISRCLAKASGDRFASGDALLDALLFLALEKPRALSPVETRPRLSRIWAAAAAVLLLIALPAGWVLLRNGASSPIVTDAGPYTGWKRIAVMEPRYVGKEASRPYLVQGIVDEIGSALAANTSLEVISTLSTRVYNQSEKPAPQIAKELVADGLIESTLYDEPGGLTLHIRLSEAPSGSYLWHHRVDLSDADVFKIQEKVEGVLYAEFAPVWLRTGDHLQRAGTVEAYSLFLEGKRLFNLYTIQDNRRAIEKFQQSSQKDPAFAPAWAALARAYGNVVNLEEELDAAWLDKAHEAAERAIDLAPRLPDGYEARANTRLMRYLYFATGDRDGIEKDLDKALQLSPDYPDALQFKAFLLLTKGVELDDPSVIAQSLQLYQRALTLQPNLPNPESNYAYALALTGQSDLAIERLERLVTTLPDSVGAYDTLSTVRFLTGDPEGAIDACLQSLRREPESQLNQLRLAAFYAATGNRRAASDIIQRLASARGAYEDFYAASALAGLGRDEKALRRLKSWKSAIEDRREHSGAFRWWLKSDPNFKKLREAGSLDCCLEPGPGKSG
jgi:tetratricopeptide (TPR) repeat protein